MRDLEDILTPNELYVYQSHPAKTYKVLANELGLSYSRVSKIKQEAKKKITKEKNREQMDIRACQRVDLTLQRREVQIILRALSAYSVRLIDVDMRKKERIDDPDYEIVKKLIPYFSELLTQNNIKLD